MADYWQAFTDKLGFFKTRAAEDHLKVYVAAPGQNPLVAIDETEKHDPASLTKLMTAYLVFRAGNNVPTSITISEHAEQYGNRKFNAAKKGDTLPWENAISAMTTGSDNRVAAAIAEALGNGKTPSDRHRDFVLLMNKTAAELGMNNTRYTNSSGMVPHPDFPNRDQTRELAETTAADTAILLTTIYRDFPEQAKRYFEADAVAYQKKNPITQHPNHRLKRDGSVFYVGKDLQLGCKTGYTDRALHNIGCMAHDDDNNQFIVVALGNADAHKKRALQVVETPLEYPEEARTRNGTINGSYVRDARVAELLRAWSKVTIDLKREVCAAGQSLVPGSFAYAAAGAPIDGPMLSDLSPITGLSLAHSCVIER